MPGESMIAASRHRAAAIRAAGAAGAVLAAVAVWLIARYGAGVVVRTPGFTPAQHPAPLGAGFVVVAAAVASLAAWGAVTLIDHTTARPRMVWVITGLLVTAVSLSAPLTGHGITPTQRLALICMHLGVAAVLVPVLAASLHPDRRPAGHPAADPAAGAHRTASTRR